jgi:hypothetical protein
VINILLLLLDFCLLELWKRMVWLVFPDEVLEQNMRGCLLVLGLLYGFMGVNITCLLEA